MALAEIQEQGATLKVLNAYIAREVLKGSLLAVLVLLALLNFFTFTDEMRDMTGNYGLLKIFEYLALDSPRNLYELMPSAALLGSLVTLGALGNNRELVAMQAAGASKFRIVWGVIRAGLMLILISGAVGEYVAPPAERAAQVLKATAMNQQVASRTKYGFWVRDGDTFINIRQIQQRDQLGDISIFELDKSQRLKLVTHAEKAVYDGQHWDLDNLKLSHIHYEEVMPDAKAKADWSSILAPDLLNVFVVRPENLSAYELANYMLYLRDNGQKSPPVELAFWSRIVNPFVTLTMLLVATPFVLTLRRETSLGQRIVVGVTFGLGFYLFDRMFGHFGLIYDMNPILAASFPTVLMFAAASIAIAKLR